MRELERLDEAYLMALGMVKGTQPIIARANSLHQKISGPVEETTREEMSRRADELWAQHEKALAKRPVS